MDVVDYGIFFLTNGTQYAPPFYLPKDTISRISSVYHCAMFITVVTDSPMDFESQIDLWIREECQRLKKDPTECFRPKYQENKVTSVLPVRSPEEEGGKSTYSPYTRTSIDPSAKCTDRKDTHSCQLDQERCSWFDVTLGCRPIEYCEGLLNSEACGRRKKFCLWRNLKCQSRSLG